MTMRRPIARGGTPSAIRAVGLIVALLGSGCSAASSAGSSGSVPASPAASAGNGPSGLATPGATPNATPARTPIASPTPLEPSFGLLGPLPPGELEPARSAALQAVLDSIVAGGEPDVIAAVITKDGRWTGAAGRGGPDRSAVTAKDEFSIASITKTVVAALVMRLVEAGKMDLDAPLASYLGDLKVDANGATVRQALGMRAGLLDTRQDTLDKAYADPARVWTTPEIVATFDPPSSGAGGSFMYSNPTYKLLGFAVEHVTGMSLASAVRTKLIEPVGLTRLLVQGPEAKTPKPWALPLDGHLGGRGSSTFGKGDALPSLADATFSVGGSAMASDARSLAVWGWHLFAGDVIQPASLKSMATVDGDGQGLGLNRFFEFGDQKAYGQAGTKSGYASLLVAFPEDQAVVVVFINDQDGSTFTAAGRLIDALR